MSTESLLQDNSPAEWDSLEYHKSTGTDSQASQDYLIFFISGNPGLIYYYEPFLSKLQSLLSLSSFSPAHFQIYGHSYKGFEISPHVDSISEPAGLKQQIKHHEECLRGQVRKHQGEFPGKSLKVILVGHSVGSYVLLELIQRHKQMVQNDDEVDDFDLIGGILLFPTIAEISQSNLGRIARLILPLPGFVGAVGVIARFVTSVLSESALNRVVQLATRFPEYAAKTTTAFLKSSMGVKQALHLARDEMRMIKNEWDSELELGTILGKEGEFVHGNVVIRDANKGLQDRWVADHTRDNIIRAQKEQGQVRKEEYTTQSVIDDRGTRHDFCTTLDSSDYVAGEVKNWIDDIIMRHGQMMRRSSTFGKPPVGQPT
ncbi:uncharacterized protein KY384_001507 [Bacidia gigantensis]|uniref:uncharacterized protein n=1 Tax=Bacidia gigantensis TaxID=2732470 RepID=UPI001D057E84|nr:uncharacterized protein KY384_001507 [Bacidia gigantensis]KAG8533766.1 hypothetical protein KY384_001507 [Bacidia gigantensis]